MSAPGYNRDTALSHSLNYAQAALKNGTPMTDEEVVDYARTFERYLDGGGESGSALRIAVDELADAIRATVDYVGMGTLPPIEGWSWYDALCKHEPQMADAFLNEYVQRQLSKGLAKDLEDAQIRPIPDSVDVANPKEPKPKFARHDVVLVRAANGNPAHAEHAVVNGLMGHELLGPSSGTFVYQVSPIHNGKVRRIKHLVSEHQLVEVAPEVRRDVLKQEGKQG